MKVRFINLYDLRRMINSMSFRSGFVCEQLDAPQDGQVRLTGITPGSVATYRCNVGFSLTGGNENRRCVDGTGWGGAAPTCEREYNFSYLRTLL